ncbi:N-acetylglucosamine-6-phosphate deacetylase [Pelosinus sp. IPA-1]|uniref:N-acetylglucosamine-6-phosphate deacetylase n=1 Tax=Pelosinus sp. IPA-1 TaxID=3029569 RepID=UPI0024362782|nr:N-acetylglucosamine-6-phosphate deacetylase [Pelosinus sp. IPA-1]GMA98288.1 N-acetylglucosamine-6-phosphate deacetylase [Pelosinus sp. IPA-1]
MKAIRNGKIITLQGILHNQVVIFEEKIIGIVPEEQLSQYTIDELLDAGGRYVSPGFIDVHVHGCNGFDTMDEEEKALAAISKGVLQTGVTSFMPTTMTMPFARIEQSMERIRQAMKESSGAQVLGCHMEGPFINENYKGAQDKRFILAPDIEKIESYLDCIKIITIAPEIGESGDFIEACTKRGLVVSIGHSSATYEQTMKAIDAGVSHMTHIFNALPPLHHRFPGAIGAAMDSDIVCELIVDNLHVHPAMQRVLLKVKGLKNIILITDAMRASLLGEGQYDLGGQNVIVKQGEARLEDGVIAGSVLTLNRGVRNFMENTGIDLVSAISLVTLNPARELGVLDRKGSIEVGKDADLVVFDDELNIFATFVGGSLLYRG